MTIYIPYPQTHIYIKEKQKHIAYINVYCWTPYMGSLYSDAIHIQFIVVLKVHNEMDILP